MSCRRSWRNLRRVERRQREGTPDDDAGLEKIFLRRAAVGGTAGGSLGRGEISSMVALGAVRSGVKLGNVHIFDSYRRALRPNVEEGATRISIDVVGKAMKQAGLRLWRFKPRDITVKRCTLAQ
jgi:hypothetical protein